MSPTVNEGQSDNAEGKTYYLDGVLGIGTQEPQAQLHLSAGGTFGDLRIFSPKAPEADFAYNGGSDGVFSFHNYGPDSGTTTFRHGNRDLLTIKNDGNVGIGTVSPNHTFHVVAADAVGLFESTGGQAYLRLSTNEGLDNRVEITNRPGGRLSLWTAGGGDAFNITRLGEVGIGTIAPKAKLHVTADIIAGSDVNGQKFIFHSRTNGAGDFLQLTGDDANGNWLWDRGLTFVRGTGNVGIGTTSPSQRLHVAGGVVATGNISTHGYDPYGGGHFPSNWNGGIHTWDVVCEATVGYSGLHQWSSIREKENIEYIGTVLDRIEALNPARFDRKPGYHNQSKGNLGFIAEEVKEVFPELVHADEQNDFFATSVRTDGMLALAIAGIKELSQQLRSLQSCMAIDKQGQKAISRHTSWEDDDRPVQILREHTSLSRNGNEERYILVRFRGSVHGADQIHCTRAYQIPNEIPKDRFLREKYVDWFSKVQNRTA